MRLHQRNLQPLWYAHYTGMTEILEDGKHTGQYTPTYSAPVRMLANISPGSGYTKFRLFGNLSDYERTVITDDLSCPIDENTVLLIGQEYTSGTFPYNYRVIRKAQSLNYIAYAVQKVPQT